MRILHVFDREPLLPSNAKVGKKQRDLSEDSRPQRGRPLDGCTHGLTQPIFGGFVVRFAGLALMYQLTGYYYY